MISSSKVLFLDIDGVLNKHTRFANGSCGIDPECVAQFNRIVAAHPDLSVIVTSAWRYLCHTDGFTVRQFAHLLCTHGLDVRDRIVGITEPDEPHPIIEDRKRLGSWDFTDEEREVLHAWGMEARAHQIWRMRENVHDPYHRWAVLDDLPLDVRNLFQTDSTVGLTSAIANRVIAHFKGAKNG